MIPAHSSATPGAVWTNPRRALHVQPLMLAVPRPPATQPMNLGAQWIPPGRSVLIGGYTIPCGLLYVGQRLSAPDGRPEPALIDPSLPVDHRHPDWAGAGLDYWPSYATIPPQSRAAYQAWLADGRRYPDVPIGYVFLFFYGLERRIVVDLPNDPSAARDVPAITAEINRLLALYTNRSFHSYATRFLEVLQATGTGITLPGERPPAMTANRWPIPMTLRRGLGGFAAAGSPVPSTWARAWAWYHPMVPQRTAVTRCRAEFDRLFTVRFAERFGAGILIRPDGPRLVLPYRAASSGLQRSSTVLTGLPDVFEQESPVRALTDLVEAVTDELDAYSRWLGRHPDGRGTLAAAALLPDPLVDDSSGDIGGLRRWASQRLGGDAWVIVNGVDLIANWPAETPGRLARTEYLALVQLLGRFGIGVEPDPRFGGPTLQDGPAVLFRCAPSGPRVASAGYAAATTLLHLAVAVSAADGIVSTAEQQLLADHMHAALHLTASERLRLQAHVQWLIAHGVTLTGLARRLAALTISQREDIGQFLIDVAAADGVIDPAEVTVLVKIYKLLDLDPDLVFSRLHQTGLATPPGPGQAAAANELPVVQQAGDGPAGYAIPPQPAQVEDETSPAPQSTAQSRSPRLVDHSFAVALDAEAVAAKLAETAAVSALLSTVFVDDEPCATSAASGIEALPIAQPTAGPTDVGADSRERQPAIPHGPHRTMEPPITQQRRLDPDALAVRSEETTAVSELLSTVFVDQESPSTAAPSDQRSSALARHMSNVPALVTLDHLHRRLLDELLTRESWSRAEYEAMAERYGVMPAGALEVLNEAALDATGEPIAEGDDEITINDYALEELRRA